MVAAQASKMDTSKAEADSANGDLIPALVLTQQISATPQRVFDALLDPRLVCRWMGPRTMVNSCEVTALDARVGGQYRFKMERRADAPRGAGTMYITGTYEEIAPPKRLVYSWKWEDQQEASRVTFELQPQAGGTQVRLTHDGFASIESKQGHERGWAVSMQQLAEAIGSV